MSTIAPGQWVRLRYRMFDSSGLALEPVPRELTYLHGGFGELLSALEEALEGRGEDESVSAYLEPGAAFGDYEPGLIQLVPRSALPAEIEPGMTFEGVPGQASDGRLYVATDVTADTVVLDANHPLAGMAVRFEIEIQEVWPASEEEVGAERERIAQAAK
jgi:FKBP-type peptidyl-prolyl cis-trans isomerase SlyD